MVVLQQLKVGQVKIDYVKMCKDLVRTEVIQDEQRDQNFAAIDKAAPECVYGLDECQTKSDIKNIRQLRS